MADTEKTRLDDDGLQTLWELIVRYINSRSIGGNIDIDNIINLLPLYSINGRVVDSTESVAITVGKDISVGQTLGFKYDASAGYSYNITYTDGSFSVASKQGVTSSAEYTDAILIEDTFSSISITGATFIYVVPPQKEAQDIIYDDTTTQLNATNTQEALEQLDNKFKADYITEQYTTGNPAYRKYASGLIEQWGRSSIGDSGYVIVELPLSFTNSNYFMQVTPEYVSGGSQVASLVSVQRSTVNSFVIYVRNHDHTVAPAGTCVYWEVKGY